MESIGIKLVAGAVLAAIILTIWTNPQGTSAVGNSLTGFTNAYIKGIEGR